MSWSEAQSYCREKHTDLATVRSQNEAVQLLNIAGASLNAAAWIGLYRDDTQNWQWSNSDDVIYSNWTAELFCASVNSIGEWRDLLCQEKNPFMCYKETSNITERYTLIEEMKTWTEAQQYCREYHTDLVSIKSASENEDLVKKAQGKPFWIGLFNNPWKWSRQGDNYTFHSWYTGEPNNESGNEKCVVMNVKGEWYDSSCRGKDFFVCCSGGSSGNCSFEGTEKTWHEAQSYCRNHNKDLVTIQDQDKTSNITARYTLIEELKTWTEAQQYCREHHTDLVSIKSASENEDLVKKAQGKTFWIGLFNNPWKWSHQGDNYTFQNWASTQPKILRQ
ncbi:snaclec coagulation factor IX/factor X-binding protein subunit B3-like [Huso huso]|uniref:Snaclec coagulation factor IX/factor X-binding protein subunit B3-like n=1 Tax=Huso huso TaxID=61971 RepID=A0ABR0YB08_HUSHU